MNYFNTENNNESTHLQILFQEGTCLAWLMLLLVITKFLKKIESYTTRSKILKVRLLQHLCMEILIYIDKGLVFSEKGKKKMQSYFFNVSYLYRKHQGIL